MQKLVIGSLVTAITMGMALQVSAAPTIFPPANNRLNEVANYTNPRAQVIADSEDRELFYVFPPTSGSTRVQNVSYSYNINMCAEMDQLLATRLYLVQEIQRYAERIEEFDKEVLDPLYDELAEYHLQMAELYQEGSVRMAADALMIVDDLDMRIMDIVDYVLPDCDLLPSDELITACIEDVMEEYNELRDERRDAYREYISLRRAAGDQYREYLQAQNLADAVEEDIERREDRRARYLTDLIALRTTLGDLYREYALIHGAYAAISFESGWDDAVAALEYMNPRFAFQPIPTQNAQANVSIIPGFRDSEEDNYLSYLEPVLYYSVNGVDYDPANPTLNLGAHPDSMAANLGLNLIGACAYKSEEDAGNDPSTTAYGLSIEYEYPSLFFAEADGWYNMWHTYRYFKSVEESGILWWKNVDVEEWEDEDGDTAMEINIRDQGDLWTEAEEDEIRLMIQQQLMQDMLKQFGRAYSDPASPGQMITTTTGLEVLADGVMNTCGWYSFACRGVGWTIRAIDAIMPGPDAEYNFQTSYDHNVSFSLSEENLKWRSGITVFSQVE